MFLECFIVVFNEYILIEFENLKFLILDEVWEKILFDGVVLMLSVGVGVLVFLLKEFGDLV